MFFTRLFFDTATFIVLRSEDTFQFNLAYVSMVILFRHPKKNWQA